MPATRGKFKEEEMMSAKVVGSELGLRRFDEKKEHDAGPLFEDARDRYFPKSILSELMEKPSLSRGSLTFNSYLCALMETYDNGNGVVIVGPTDNYAQKSNFLRGDFSECGLNVNIYSFIDYTKRVAGFAFEKKSGAKNG